MDRQIILIAHNLRSCHNVGALLRTAEGLNIQNVYLTGYTPYPQAPNDSRLPHIQRQVGNKINKTALGAEITVNWEQQTNIDNVLSALKKAGYTIVGLEQTPKSISVATYKPTNKIALLIGREVEGIESDILEQTDLCLEIPMLGKKESFNVVEATSMALFHCRFAD